MKRVFAAVVLGALAVMGCDGLPIACTIFCATDMQVVVCQDGASCSVVGDTCTAADGTLPKHCDCVSRAGTKQWKCMAIAPADGGRTD